MCKSAKPKICMYMQWVTKGGLKKIDTFPCVYMKVWTNPDRDFFKIYFAFSSLVLLIYVIDEWDYLVGRRHKPKGETIIEKGDISEAHVIFNIIVLICSVGLVASSIIMLYGLKRDKREYLLPWILLMIGDVCVELFYAIYFIFSKRANFDPIVGFIFTIDLFIVCLNTYCLLCVISQYQEYKEIAKRTKQEINQLTVIIEPASNNLCDNVPVKMPNPIFHKKTTKQVNRSTHFLLMSNHCSTISAIPEEEDPSETQL